MQRKKIPFQVSRNDTRTLVCQVTDGLRQLVLGGFYVPGDTLPPYDELSRSLGVSQIVTRAAVRTLSDEGLVVVRPRLGTVVRNCGEKQWRGHVVLVSDSGNIDNYLKMMLVATMQGRLTEAGYLFSQSVVGENPDGSPDFSHLDAILSRTADFVLVMHHLIEICSYLARRGIRYAVFGELVTPPRGAAGIIRYDHAMAVGGFAAACHAAGIEEVSIVYWRWAFDYAAALTAAGLKVRQLKVDVDESEGRLIGVKRAGRIAFGKECRQIANGAYLFTDDYLAAGALLALAQAGLRAPEDVRVATWANCGLGPDYHRPLSRMEMDPQCAGLSVADALLAFLKTGEFPSGVTGGPRWIDGETLSLPRHGGAQANTNPKPKTRRAKQ